jgi:hypothetical protein
MCSAGVTIAKHILGQVSVGNMSVDNLDVNERKLHQKSQLLYFQKNMQGSIFIRVTFFIESATARLWSRAGRSAAELAAGHRKGYDGALRNRGQKGDTDSTECLTLVISSIVIIVFDQYK